MSRKRKRAYTPAYATYRRRRPSGRGGYQRIIRPARAAPRFRGRRAGFQRTAGFYGRYGQGSAEAKFHDVDLDDTLIAAPSTMTDSICKIAQGVTESTRVGRKCTITKIMWRYHMTLPEKADVASPGACDIIRVILYWDRQANGATAAITDLLKVDELRSFNNLANTGRFKILMDRTHEMNYIGGVGNKFDAAVMNQPEVRRAYSFYKSCNIPIEFSATTGAITEIKSNNLGVALMSIKGVVLFESHIRLRFMDT